ncbi:TPA: hypothetical protein QFF40_000286 [Enterococcus faecium]
MIMKILLVVAVFIITNHIQKRRYQKKLDNLTFRGMGLKKEGEIVKITLLTSEGVYQVDSDKEIFIEKVKDTLEEDL